MLSRKANDLHINIIMSSFVSSWATIIFNDILMINIAITIKYLKDYEVMILFTAFLLTTVLENHTPFSNTLI